MVKTNANLLWQCKTCENFMGKPLLSLSSHLLCFWFRPTLTLLASIIYNHSACLSSVFVCVSLCDIVIWILHCSSCIWTLFFHHHFFFFSVVGVWVWIFKFSPLSSSFFFFSSCPPPPPPPIPPPHPPPSPPIPPPPPPTLSSFHHYCGSQRCYYRFMCSLLACRLAGTDCKNRQLPKIVILV